MGMLGSVKKKSWASATRFTGVSDPRKRDHQEVVWKKLPKEENDTCFTRCLCAVKKSMWREKEHRGGGGGGGGGVFCNAISSTPLLTTSGQFLLNCHAYFCDVTGIRLDAHVKEQRANNDHPPKREYTPRTPEWCPNRHSVNADLVADLPTGDGFEIRPLYRGQPGTEFKFLSPTHCPTSEPGTEFPNPSPIPNPLLRESQKHDTTTAKPSRQPTWTILTPARHIEDIQLAPTAKTAVTLTRFSGATDSPRAKPDMLNRIAEAV